MSQPQQIITGEPQPQDPPPGFQQPLPGQYPSEQPPPVQPGMPPGPPPQPMMQPGQPVPPMMSQGQYAQPMMSQGQYAQPMMQPVQMQPQTTTTTNVVMINQQPAAPPPLREWSTGLCGCFDDCGTCCYAIFCSQYLLSDISQRMGEGRCFACCCHNALLSLRIKYRTEQRIEGSLCKDYMAVDCCYLLVLCQLARELDYVQRVHTR